MTGRAFCGIGRHVGLEAMAGHYCGSVIVGGRDYNCVLPECRAGVRDELAGVAGALRRPGTSVRFFSRAALLLCSRIAPARRAPAGRGPARAAILVYSPASCRGRQHQKHRRWPERCPRGIHWITHSNMGSGSAGPLLSRPGQLPAGNLSVWMRVCVLKGLLPDLALVRKFAFLPWSNCELVKGTAPCRDPDGSANSGQRWSPTGSPQKGRKGRD